MWNFETIAVIVGLITAVIGLMTIGRHPGEYQRRLQSTPAIFRWFHLGALWVLMIWSIVYLGLTLAGFQSNRGIPWIPTVFMLSWWPLILNDGNSPSIGGLRMGESIARDGREAITELRLKQANGE